MILRTGVDMVDIYRLQETLDKHRQRFLQRVFTPGELELANGSAQFLSGRFAAKEAVSKALGVGIGVIRWQDVEVLCGENKEPVMQLHGEAARLAQEMGLETWSLSISHSVGQAVAFVVAIGTPQA